MDREDFETLLKIEAKRRKLKDVEAFIQHNVEFVLLRTYNGVWDEDAAFVRIRFLQEEKV